MRKDGPLTPEERRVIELHPEYGHEIVRGIGFLEEARAAILHHHERLDGRGYPYGLRGHHIPECARVVAVADAFDAMTSTRSYRRARPVPAAVAELRKCAGEQFDARMVRALAASLDRYGWQPDLVTAADAEAGAVREGQGAVAEQGAVTAEGAGEAAAAWAAPGAAARVAARRSRAGRCPVSGVPEGPRPVRPPGSRTGDSCAARPPRAGMPAARGGAVIAAVYAPAGALACWSLGHTLWEGLAEPGIALAFGVLIAVGELAGWGPAPHGPGRAGAGRTGGRPARCGRRARVRPAR